MPTYEYTCKACHEHLEVVQPFHEASLTTCPSCGGELRKVFGNVGIVFKGSGFYKTDSRTTAAGSAKASADKAPETTSTDGAKTEAKKEPVKAEAGSTASGSSSSGDGTKASGSGSGAAPAPKVASTS